ncbi:MAG: hypothetical protein Q4C99_06340, partial [Clostridia bacterium]|nr:hypothetical protein [Clostridia bacterium]
MCIAIYSLKGTDIPSEDILKTCFLNNPDGAGFAFNKGGKVHIVKGFMDYKGFIAAFKKYDAEFGFKQRGVLIHFRIATHGGVNVGCCHPFPISSNEKQLKKSKTISDYAVIHNGIIFLTADKKSPLSDTMLFIRDYLTKIGSNRNWFYNKKNTELIYELINSKMAILNGNGDITATEGFHKGADGNYYSNCSYMNTCLSLYDEWFYDDAFSEMPLMQLKRNEIVCFKDGRTEEYESGFHDLYPIYLTKEGDVYADYIGCSAGEKIPMEQ